MFFRRLDDKKLKGLILMIDNIYNSPIGAIKTCHFSDEWGQNAIPFEDSLTEEQDYHIP